MSKSQLPYPGKYESAASWYYRCKEWEARRSSQSRGLSGRPDFHGLACQGRGVELQSTKQAGRFVTVEVPHFVELNGQRVRVLRYGYGATAADRVRNWAAKHGAKYARLPRANGQTGMCARTDGMAYREVQFQ